MKKTFISLAVLCGATLFAGEVPLDSSFAALTPDGVAPQKWTKEFAHQGGFGECKLLPGKDDKNKILQVLTASKLTNFYYNDMFKVAPGDEIVMTAKVSGEGTFAMTLYVYENGYLAALPYKLTEVNSTDAKNITFSYKIAAAYNNKTPKIARAVFCIGAESLINVSGIKVVTAGK